MLLIENKSGINNLFYSLLNPISSKIEYLLNELDISIYMNNLE